MQNDPLWGPLFRPNRNATSNAGQPIFTAGGSASDLSASPAMAETIICRVGAISGFNQTLDFGLHGNVHVFTGNSQGMGQVPWAANDPIFWMHHCNIDRIWVSWNNAGHANPDHGGVAEQDIRVRRPRRQGREGGREGLHQHQEVQLQI